MQRSQSKTLNVALVAVVLTVLAFSSSEAYGQSTDHMTSDQSHLPTANIGDRQASLDFRTNPEVATPADPVDVSISLIDANTGNNIPHVTYTVIISDATGKQVFSELFHGHDGKVDARFLHDDSVATYKVSGHYDTLSASYVSDFGAIKVQGRVFSDPGDHKVTIEVIGIDFDNTFLPEPIIYELTVPVAQRQSLSVDYEDRVFEVGVYSQVTVGGARLDTENRQLILRTDNSSHSGDLRIMLEIPAEMMSGPFSASYGDGTLDVQESASGETTWLVLTGEHAGAEESDIVVSAASVIPEFPIGLTGAVSAIALVGAIAYARVFGSRKLW